MLRRLMALTLMLAFISITTIPLLPKQMICAHASTELSDCEREGHHTQTLAPPKDLDMSDMVLEGTQIIHSATVSSELYQHKTLSAAEKKCRIECGCGCNRDVEGMPHLFFPHICSDILVEAFYPELSPSFQSWQARHDFILRVPIPPPKVSFT